MDVLSQLSGCATACEACHYKDLSYGEQLARKEAWANAKLSNWNSVREPIRPAPAAERVGYRSKSWLRAEFQSGEFSFGMMRAVQRDGDWEQEFISWDRCPIHTPAISALIENLKRELAKLASPVLEESLLGIWIGTPHLVVVTGSACADELLRLDWCRILVPPFDRVWFHHANQIGRKVFGHREIALLVGDPIGEAHPIRAFRQVARTLLEEARAEARNALLEYRPELVLDLYCGTGELSRLIPEETGWIGIEMSKEAVEFAKNLRPACEVRHSAYVGGVEHRLRDPRVREEIPPDYAIYLNPPRSGLSRDAEDALRDLLREKAPRTIVYLSCSASSLARDLEMFMLEGFKVKRLRSYDFFPQTEHFETLAILERTVDREGLLLQSLPIHCEGR